MRSEETPGRLVKHVLSGSKVNSQVGERFITEF